MRGRALLSKRPPNRYEHSRAKIYEECATGIQSFCELPYGRDRSARINLDGNIEVCHLSFPFRRYFVLNIAGA
jgi:hypothetical protein